jgi:tRNA(Leu) C34 or U34 (ribose-2'-O)-methylase TrmL
MPLPGYKHPERALYIFGPEDGTLGHDVLDWCRDVVYVPTNGCMNLAATVNVVLYDRMTKTQRT